LHGFYWSRLCEFILYSSSQARVGVRFIKVKFGRWDATILKVPESLVFFFSDILHLCFSICQQETLSRRLGHGSGSLSLALCPAIQHYHCGICGGTGLSFFPVTLVSPSHVLPQMLHTVLPSEAGAKATVPSNCLALIMMRSHPYSTAANTTGAQIPGARVPGWLNF
jgi:hypothetical protein